MIDNKFLKKILPLLDKINAILPDVPSDLAMLALAVALGERIAEENDDMEERVACLSVMMKIVEAGVEEEEIV
jgi:alkylhydroperoxidase/carboxymuconolactone decarboxylase family protein YurZ